MDDNITIDSLFIDEFVIYENGILYEDDYDYTIKDHDKPWENFDNILSFPISSFEYRNQRTSSYHKKHKNLNFDNVLNFEGI